MGNVAQGRLVLGFTIGKNGYKKYIRPILETICNRETKAETHPNDAFNNLRVMTYFEKEYKFIFRLTEDDSMRMGILIESIEKKVEDKGSGVNFDFIWCTDYVMKTQFEKCKALFKELGYEYQDLNAGTHVSYTYKYD